MIIYVNLNTSRIIYYLLICNIVLFVGVCEECYQKNNTYILKWVGATNNNFDLINKSNNYFHKLKLPLYLVNTLLSFYFML